MSEGQLPLSGDLVARKVGPRHAHWQWRLLNALRWAYLKGWTAKHVVLPVASWFGLMVAIGELSIRVKRIDGWVDYGVVGYRVITTAGVGFLVDAWDNAGVNLEDMNYHGCGTGTNAENASDSALQTESTTALNPNSTRATGTRSQPSANIYRSVGTLTFDADAAVTEHGLLSQAATGGGVLWDRTVFSAINVVGANADSIQFTYSMTASSGG